MKFLSAAAFLFVSKGYSPAIDGNGLQKTQSFPMPSPSTTTLASSFADNANKANNPSSYFDELKDKGGPDPSNTMDNYHAGNPNMSSFNAVNRDPVGAPGMGVNNGPPSNYGQRTRPVTDAGSSWQSVSRETQSSNPYGRASDSGSPYGAIPRESHPASNPYGRTNDVGSPYGAVSRETQGGGYRAPVSDVGASWNTVNIDTGAAGRPHQNSIHQQARMTDSGSSWQSVSREELPRRGYGGPSPGMGGPAHARGQPPGRVLGDVGASWDTVNIDTVSSTGHPFSTHTGKRITDSGASWESVSRETEGARGPPRYSNNKNRRPVTDSGTDWGRVNMDTGSFGGAQNPSNQRAQVTRITDSGSSWRPVDREELPRRRPSQGPRRPISDVGTGWGTVNTENVSFNSRPPVAHHDGAGFRTMNDVGYRSVSRETSSVPRYGRGTGGDQGATDCVCCCCCCLKEFRDGVCLIVRRHI